MADIVTIVQALASVVAVWFAYKTVRLAHLKMTADERAAVSAIEHSEAQAKKRAMVDLIIAQKTDPNFIRDSKIVRSLKERDIDFLEFAAKDSPERDAVLSVLNQIEFIAVGIRLGAFDESVYKELSCNSVIKTWDSACSFVTALRDQTGIQTLFQDLEKLVNRWKDDPIKPI